jgi:GNAT superfamily N-acetyltransferase
MEPGYFNHRAYIATRGAAKKRFLAHWRQFYAGDRHWIPPHHPALSTALRSEHVQRSEPVYLHLEALPRLDKGRQQMPGPGQALLHSIWERPVATAALLNDRRQHATLLALFRCVNDRTTLVRLLERAGDEESQGTLLGPVALSPHLGAGVLASHWSETPPLHTPYAPPYLAPLLEEVMELAAESHLYHFDVGAINVREEAGPARLEPLDPARLSTDLAPLFAQVCGGGGLFAPPDATEVAFMLAWWGSLLPLSGWLATVGGEPAGLVLLQPDGGGWLQRAGGGRRLWWRWWLQAGGKQASRGRLLAGGVLPALRRQGIGRQLLAAARQSAAAAGWRSLVAGPVLDGSEAAAFLTAAGGEARQRYQLFRWQSRSDGWW